MRIDELMTREVVTVSPETPLKEIAALLLERGISGVPVCAADGTVLGVVSEQDILHKELGSAEQRSLLGRLARRPEPARLKTGARTARDAMTSPALTIGWNRPVSAAARLMVEQRVNRLPVTGVGGALVGIVTRADLVRAFSRSDDAIRAEIEHEVLERSLWIPSGTLDVDVDHGEVTVAGAVESQGTLDALPELLEKVPGVVGVQARLTLAH